MRCPSCGTENEPGRKFCGECGSALARSCPSCGAPNAPGVKFCGECGAALTAAAAAPTPTAAAPVAERRLVSVLFADLVGFTNASEARDAEDTRDLLSRYFDLCRRVVARYGGTVEKFIGDAVMAVWGTPTATEDDAERAVRAALDLVAAIPDLDPALRARAGVLTGEAAVTIGADGEGMVAGDLVNTASRIQSAAEPGTVLVGAATVRATEQSIAYESSGEHQLKGKQEPLQLWRPLRVVSGVGGSLKAAGLEPPFVGRDRELKLIKDLFHATADDSRAHLVSITGIAGIGKSRLAWEFYKYFDGVVEQVWWHRGRSLAYGEGVAFWALADMVRMRCRIVEEEEPASAREKLKATLADHIPDAGERAYVEPRLAQLIGLEEARSTDRQDLFAAWRLFFERLAASGPTILAFEDLQWADAGLLDFIEYLLEWSRDRPIFVIAMARPELQERRPGWGAGQRGFTSLYLEPLAEPAMRALLEAMVPGLPGRLGAQILGRAQGVPLYAVETVRMLLDRGLLVPDGSAYRVAGEIETLEVPETLHALIAARLDGLSATERRLLQDGAVLGKTFSRGAVAALAEMAEVDVEPVLTALVRKEVFSLVADPRSPDRGQYGFLQDLVRHVAYESLAKSERKSRHLAAAEYLRRAFGQEEEVAEVLASHLVAAYSAAPAAEDAGEIRDRARAMLERAGDRALSVGAPDEACRYYEQAAGLTEDPLEQAELLRQAGLAATKANHPVESRRLLERALSLAGASDARIRARIAVALGHSDFIDGRTAEGIDRLRDAVADLDSGTPDPEVASALAQLGRLLALSSSPDDALPFLDRARHYAELLQLPDVFLNALVNQSIVLVTAGRYEEARILLKAAVERAADQQMYEIALRATNNLIATLEQTDRLAEVVPAIEHAVEIARLRGERSWEGAIRIGAIYVFYLVGRWDEAVQIAAEEIEDNQTEYWQAMYTDAVFVHAGRGEMGMARSLLEGVAGLRESTNHDYQASYQVAEAVILAAEGRHAESLAIASPIARGTTAVTRRAVELVCDAAVAMGELDLIEEQLASLRALYPSQQTDYVRALAARLEARLEIARGGGGEVEERYRDAIEHFGAAGALFPRATYQLELAEWLHGCGRAVEALQVAAEAREVFESLRAAPWLARCAAIGAVSEAAVPLPG